MLRLGCWVEVRSRGWGGGGGGEEGSGFALGEAGGGVRYGHVVGV